jgi:hypothetical protein
MICYVILYGILYYSIWYSISYYTVLYCLVWKQYLSPDERGFPLYDLHPMLLALAHAHGEVRHESATAIPSTDSVWKIEILKGEGSRHEEENNEYLRAI